MYIVSACLLGANCKYNGGNNDNEDVKDFCEGHRILAVCPETEGGLSSPRPPAEQQGEKVVDCEGKDVTAEFRNGAEICLQKVLDSGARGPEGEQSFVRLMLRIRRHIYRHSHQRRRHIRRAHQSPRHQGAHRKRYIRNNSEGAEKMIDIKETYCLGNR